MQKYLIHDMCVFFAEMIGIESTDFIRRISTMIDKNS